MSNEEESRLNIRDHDLIIRLNTKLETIETTVKETSLTQAYAQREMKSELIEMLKEIRNATNERLDQIEKIHGTDIRELQTKMEENEKFHTEIRTMFKMWGVGMTAAMSLIELGFHFLNK